MSEPEVQLELLDESHELESEYESSDLSSLSTLEGDDTEEDNTLKDILSFNIDELLKNYEEASKDPEFMENVIKKFKSQDDSSFFEMFKKATKSKAFQDLMENPSKVFDKLDIISTSLIEQTGERLNEQFLDACESGDLEVVKTILPGIHYTTLYKGIKLAIKTKKLRVLDYILSTKVKDDSSLLCNVWPSCANLSPENPVIDILVKYGNNDGLTHACGKGNVLLVEHLLKNGANDYQWGLNYSVRGNCLELVQKFVELAETKGAKLDIDQAARWIPNKNASPEILDYLDKMSPGCTIRGMYDVMSQVFGFPSSSNDTFFKDLTVKLSEIGSIKDVQERTSEATKILKEIGETSDSFKETIDAYMKQIQDLAQLPEEERQEEFNKVSENFMKTTLNI